MRFIDTRCTKCEAIRVDLLQRSSSEPLPACEACGEPTERAYLPGSTGKVVGDDIPGGVLIKHGLCAPDGTPIRYYSHSDIKREAEKRGLTNFVVHEPKPGSDKSPHTTRWV